jgi:hypothetical protein
MRAGFDWQPCGCLKLIPAQIRFLSQPVPARAWQAAVLIFACLTSRARTLIYSRNLSTASIYHDRLLDMIGFASSFLLLLYVEKVLREAQFRIKAA